MTICVRCGAGRRYIPDSCPRCSFQPSTRRELAVAALLTEAFGDGGGAPYGTPGEELKRIADRIEAGDHPSLSESAIRRHEGAVDALLKMDHSVSWMVLQVMRPALIFLAALLLIWVVLRFVVR